MPVPASDRGTSADQSCRVTHVKVEELAASYGAHSRPVGGNSADSDESVDLVIQVHEVFRRTDESSWRCHLAVMQFVKRHPAASSYHWQGGPCTGSFGRGVPCQGVTKWLKCSSSRGCRAIQMAKWQPRLGYAMSIGKGLSSCA